jgi:hypothetical protein
MLWATCNSDTRARPSRGRHAGASQRRGRRASARLRKRQSDASLGSCRHVARTSVGRARSDRRGLLPHPRKRRCPGGLKSRLETSALEVRTTRSRLELAGGAPNCKRRAAQAATVGPRRCRGESPPSARRGVAIDEGFARSAVAELTIPMATKPSLQQFGQADLDVQRETPRGLAGLDARAHAREHVSALGLW